MTFTNATTLEEALEALAAGARPIAGGTDLVVGARHGKAPLPDNLVAIDRIDALRYITETTDGVSIGAMATHHDLETHPLITTVYAGLADAAALVGSPATRNVGTLGGNLMNGSPAMDTGAPLAAMGAEVELRSVRGVRRFPLKDLWSGPGRTIAEPDELCVAVHVPLPAARAGSAYLRLEYRRAMEIAVVGAAAAVTLDGDGKVTDLRMALSAVAPTIVYGRAQGLTADEVDHVAEQAAAFARAHSAPISDVRASEAYRRHTVGVMAQRAVQAAARRAAGEHLPTPLNRTTGIGAAR